MGKKHLLANRAPVPIQDLSCNEMNVSFLTAKYNKDICTMLLPSFECQEAALTRRIAWQRSRGGVGLGLSGKQLHPATPELTAWQERPTDSSQ